MVTTEKQIVGILRNDLHSTSDEWSIVGDVRLSKFVQRAPQLGSGQPEDAATVDVRLQLDSPLPDGVSTRGRALPRGRRVPPGFVHQHPAAGGPVAAAAGVRGLPRDERGVGRVGRRAVRLARQPVQRRARRLRTRQLLLQPHLHGQRRDLAFPPARRARRTCGCRPAPARARRVGAVVAHAGGHGAVTSTCRASGGTRTGARAAGTGRDGCAARTGSTWKASTART